MHDTLTTRHAQLVAERETAARRYQQQTVLLDGRITQLRAELAELEQARTDAQIGFERQDYAYAAVIGELERLLPELSAPAPAPNPDEASDVVQP